MNNENNFTENNLDDIFRAIDFITDLMDSHLAPSDEKARDVYYKVDDLLDEAWCVLKNYLLGDEEG